MQPDELHAVIDLFSASWSHSLTLSERAVWTERFESYPRHACMKAIRTAAEHFSRRPSWAELRPLLVESSRALAPVSPGDATHCDCDGGWIFTDTNTVKPCARCRPDQHQAWRAGAYAPHGGAQPRSDESKPLDRDAFQRGIDEARGELIKKGITQ